MANKKTIVRVSAETAQAMVKNGESMTDWARAEAMPQAEVDRLADEEDGPLPDGWEASVVIGIPEPKQAVHIRLDAGVLEWFRGHGPGYQTRINAVLRSFVEARLRSEQDGRKSG